jgi:hypothetical protein
MSEKSRYLDILRIEVEDLIEDIGLVVEVYKKRKERGEITNYVFLENLAVLIHEKKGLNNLMELLGSIDAESYSDLKEMIGDIEKKIISRINDSHLEEALLPLVKRRLKKVARYVNQAKG